MINTKLYKTIYKLAEDLLEADRKGETDAFNDYYAQLKTLCTTNEGTDKDHPEQWETLADFTTDFDEAFSLYDKALLKAVEMNYKDHQSSINFSKAKLYMQMKHIDAAIDCLNQAVKSAKGIEDKELRADIDDLLAQLTSDPERAMNLSNY